MNVVALGDQQAVGLDKISLIGVVEVIGGLDNQLVGSAQSKVFGFVNMIGVGDNEVGGGGPGGIFRYRLAALPGGERPVRLRILRMTVNPD
jgi:hypothetical protein